MKQGCHSGWQCLRKFGLAIASYVVKDKNEMRTSAALQKLTISCLDFDLSKVRFRAHSYI